MERDIVFIALFAALIIALGFIPPIMLPTGVPITAQTLGVMLCGTVLGAKRGAMAVLLVLALVLIGLVPLSGGRTGIGLLASPTAGFLIGWPIAAFVIGLMVERVRSIPITAMSIFASIVGGIIVLYAFGIAGMSANLDKPILQAATLALVYIPGDIVKAVIAGILTGALYKARPNSVLSRRHSDALS